MTRNGRAEGELSSEDRAWNKFVGQVRGQFDMLEDAAAQDERVLRHVKTVRKVVEDALFQTRRLVSGSGSGSIT